MRRCQSSHGKVYATIVCNREAYPGSGGNGDQFGTNDKTWSPVHFGVSGQRNRNEHQNVDLVQEQEQDVEDGYNIGKDNMEGDNRTVNTCSSRTSSVSSYSFSQDKHINYEYSG